MSHKLRSLQPPLSCGPCSAHLLKCCSCAFACTDDLLFIRSLFEKDKLLFAFGLAAGLQVDSGKMDSAELRFLLTGGVAVGDLRAPNPCPAWLSDKSWGEICRAAKLPNPVWQVSLQHILHWPSLGQCQCRANVFPLLPLSVFMAASHLQEFPKIQARTPAKSPVTRKQVANQAISRALPYGKIYNSLKLNHA